APPISVRHGTASPAAFVHCLACAPCQTPDKSGCPSGRRGAGAVRSALPSGFLGMPSVGYRSHCPDATARAPISGTKTYASTLRRLMFPPVPLPTARHRLCLFDVGQTFRHFNIRSPWIFDERDSNAKIGHLGVGTIQLDALGFKLLRESLEVFDFEADVIDRPASRADGRRRRRREVKEHARQLTLQ